MIPLLKEWQQRPLEKVSPFVWLDAIHYKIKENGRYVPKAIYTTLGVNLSDMTNIIESVHRKFRKPTKTKCAFPNENSLLKLLYMGIQNTQKKWTMPMRNWSLAISQLAIFFEDRLDKALAL